MAATLLAEFNREESTPVQGACSLLRCLLAGAAIAGIDLFANAAGLGCCFAVHAARFLPEADLVWMLLSIRFSGGRRNCHLWSSRVLIDPRREWTSGVGEHASFTHGFACPRYHPRN